MAAAWVAGGIIAFVDRFLSPANAPRRSLDPVVTLQVDLLLQAVLTPMNTQRPD
jgi:hypothetical protein